MSEVVTINEAAESVGVSRQTMSELVRLLLIEPKPVPRCPNGKGLDRHDMRRIRRAIRAGQRPAPVAR